MKTTLTMEKLVEREKALRARLTNLDNACESAMQSATYSAETSQTYFTKAYDHSYTIGRCKHDGLPAGVVGAMRDCERIDAERSLARQRSSSERYFDLRAERIPLVLELREVEGMIQTQYDIEHAPKASEEVSGEAS